MTHRHSIVTVVGRNKEAAKTAANEPMVFTEIALGDGDGFPSGGETALENEVHRGLITGSGVEPTEPNAVWFDLYVPAGFDTFYAQEIGLFDEDGLLYALSRFDQPVPKFGPDSSSLSDNTFRIVVVFSDTENVVVNVSPVAGITADTLPQHLPWATSPEAKDPAQEEKIIDPKRLHEVLGNDADGKAIYYMLDNASGPVQSVPYQVQTRCNNMVVADSEGQSGASLWNGYRFTVDEDSLGAYLVVLRLNLFGENGEGMSTWKNGVLFHRYQLNNNSGSHNVVGFTHLVNLFEPDDYIEFFHYHNSTAGNGAPVARNNSGSIVQIMRLHPYFKPEEE